jgi:general secretion pathway protein D
MSLAGMAQQAVPSASQPAAATTTKPADVKTSPAATDAAGTAKPASDATVTPPAAQAKNPADVEVSIAFAKADINNVLTFLSMASNIPVVCDAEVKGTLTIVSLKKVPLSLAFEVINSALRVRGFTMIGGLQDKIIRVVPLQKAIADRSLVNSGGDPALIASSDDIITQVIPLEYTNATKLRDEIKPLVSNDEANILAVSSSNTLIITDTAGNIHRLAQIISLLDTNTADIVEIEIYTCKYSSATAVAEELQNIFKITKNAGDTPQPGQQQGGGGQPPSNLKTDDGVLSLKGELRISPDERTNSIIISAVRPKIDVVLSLLTKLDVDTNPEVKAKIFPLTYADAKLVAEQLGKLFEQPGGSDANRSPYGYYGGQPQPPPSKTAYAGLKRNMIVADVRTNSVVVTASEQNMREYEAMIKTLDAPKVLSELSKTYNLKYANATKVATTLNQLFQGESSRNSSYNFYDLFYGGSSQNKDEGDPIAQMKNVTVVPDDKTNSLLVTGPPQAFSMVSNFVEQLDRRSVQVFIEVAIVDVTLDKTTQFGVEWNWHSNATNAAGTPNQTASTNYGLNQITTGLKYSIISNNLQAVLTALQTSSNVKVYSTPSITTMDNVQATISIGEDVPFASSQNDLVSGTITSEVSYKTVSISLTVTPHVNESSNLIAMDVQQAINEIIGQVDALNAPITANRNAQTSVMVNDGQTIVIGGIIKDNCTRTENAVPVISRIPLIGDLFKSHDYENTKSELMVFLTPHILRTEESVDQVTATQRGKLSDPGELGKPAEAPKLEKK